jgi:RNA polymerase sigma factor (sigma-70 family)
LTTPGSEKDHDNEPDAPQKLKGGSWLTRQTLIQDIRVDGSDEVWEKFFHYYEGFIKVIIYKMNIPHHHSDDITQSVLLKLWNHFKNDKEEKVQYLRFRSWLSTVIRNSVIDFIRQRKDNGQVQLDELIETHSDPKSGVDDWIEREWVHHVKSLAFDKIKASFSKEAVMIFEKTMKDEATTEELAVELGIKPNSVIKMKGRVKKVFLEEIEHLKKVLET